MVMTAGSLLISGLILVAFLSVFYTFLDQETCNSPLPFIFNTGNQFVEYLQAEAQVIHSVHFNTAGGIYLHRYLESAHSFVTRYDTGI
jgi:hypothetical protein